jgi:hypothetical protein
MTKFRTAIMCESLKERIKKMKNPEDLQWHAFTAGVRKMDQQFFSEFIGEMIRVIK